MITHEKNNQLWVNYRNKDLPTNEVDSIIDELDGLGWELVATLPWISAEGRGNYLLSYTSGYQLFFKRPMPKLPDELANALDAAQKYSG